MFGFWLKNIIYAILVSVVFYSILISADLSGLRPIEENSFSLLSLFTTFIAFNFSMLNIRFRG